MEIIELEPVYVFWMPDEIEAGKIYISKENNIAIHLCACGCNNKVVTPINSREWQLTDENGLITLRPSIGNWSGKKPYHAHYFITKNKIEWT